MEGVHRNGNGLMDDLAQMRRHLDKLETSMAGQLPRDVERLLADMRDVNERLVMASMDNLARAKAAAAEAETARQRLDAVLKLVLAGVLVAEAPSGRVILQNRQVERIWRRPLPPPSTVAEYQEYDGSHPDGRPYRPEEWPLARSIRKSETVEGEEIVLTRGDGSRGVLLANSTPLMGKRGRAVGGVMAIHDVTDSKAAAARLAHLEATTRALSEAATPEEVVSILLRQGIETLGASAGSVALLTEDGTAVRLVREVGYSTAAVEPYRHSPIDAPIPIVEAVRTGRPVLLASVEERAVRYPNLKEVGTENSAFAAVPMVARGQTVGALGLSFLKPRVLEEGEREFLGNLARHGALALAATGWYRREWGLRAWADPMP